MMNDGMIPMQGDLGRISLPLRSRHQKDFFYSPPDPRCGPSNASIDFNAQRSCACFRIGPFFSNNTMIFIPGLLPIAYKIMVQELLPNTGFTPGDWGVIPPN